MQMPYNFLPVLPHFPHTRVWGCKFDLVKEKPMVILQSSFDLTWCILSPGYYIPRFILEAFLVREKKIFKCFYHVLAVLFKDAEPFKQTDNSLRQKAQC